MNQIISTLFEYMGLKVLIAISLGTFSWLFGTANTDAVFAVLILFIFDTLTGVWAAYHEGQNITSKRFSNVLWKGVLYFMSISAGYFVDLTIPGEFVQATMIAFVGGTEFISILENMGRMGIETPKKLLNQFKERRDNL